MPTQMKITGRTSTMTHAFITSIIPHIKPTEKQVRKSLEILHISPDNITCAYCGDAATEWDHLRPLVKDKKPTGFISEIHRTYPKTLIFAVISAETGILGGFGMTSNLVPSCGKCNQSKGNRNWRDWIKSKAKRSPKSRNINNLDELIERLEKYEKWGDARVIDFEKVVNPVLWEQHWNNRQRLFDLMEKSQELATEIKKLIKSKFA